MAASFSSAPEGLSQAQVEARLEEFGANEIYQKKTRSRLLLFIDQLRSPLVIILIFAAFISAGLGEFIESLAIFAILLVNALIGFFQEYRTETAISALRDMTAPRATVLREGHHTVIAARDIVPGDILALEPGDIVAADAALVNAARLQINEAILTGESMPAHKKSVDDLGQDALGSRQTRVFMGTSVVAGTGLAKVTGTGMKTEMGRIAHLIATAKDEPTPLQLQLAHVGRILLLLCLTVVGIVTIVGFLQGRPWAELMMFSLSLAVAAVPEGMPAIVTVALALGVQRLAAQRALIRKLPSVETLGSVSIICTDKTGTLTTGEMRVREIWGADHHAILEAASACCDADPHPSGAPGTGDPTELAILACAMDHNILKATIEATIPRISTEPFDPTRRRMSVFRANGINYIKGAIESILPNCNHSFAGLEEAKEIASNMSMRGLRVLAIATGKGADEKNLTLLGLLGLADPPRPEAAKAIQEARSAGIIPIMITGDHPKTAMAIAQELGLIRGSEPWEERIYARATPEDKINLVRKWKSMGHIVAMTGDGVNDAPALREAHIGIAMGKSGTEVTRQASDLILADDNFATIIIAVKEGRGIFQNIRRATIYLLIGNFAEIVVVLFSIVLDFPLPLLAPHLLWINLVTDALPALTLIMEPLSPFVMQQPPRPANEPLLGWQEWRRIFSTGLLEASVALSLYWRLLHHYEASHARGILFSGLVLSQLFRALAARSTIRTFWQVGPFRNAWLLLVVIVTGALQISLHFTNFAQKLFTLIPLTQGDIAYLLAFSLIPVSVLEAKKIVGRLYLKNR